MHKYDKFKLLFSLIFLTYSGFFISNKHINKQQFLLSVKTVRNKSTLTRDFTFRAVLSALPSTNKAL